MVVATLVWRSRGSRSIGFFRSSETTGSPMAPSARLESVTPELDGRDEPRGVVQQHEHAARALDTLGLELLQAGAPDGDQCVLGGNEERVCRNDNQYREKLNGDQHGLGTSSLKLRPV